MTNKKRGDTVPLLSAAGKPVVLTELGAKIPAICVGDIFGMSSYRRRPSQV